MSDPFELLKRVAVACSNCRERKIKCVTQSQQEPCMRCHFNGLVCQYVSTEKQRARGSGNRTPGHHSPGNTTPSTTPSPQSPSYPTPNVGGYSGQAPSYNSSPSSASRAPYASSVPPIMGGNPYGNNPNAGSSQYRPPSQRDNSYPAVPAYLSAERERLLIPEVPCFGSDQEGSRIQKSVNVGGWPKIIDHQKRLAGRTIIIGAR
ncbi:hypothetical protein B0H13DRAFT_1878464 [Mycena leptocephala]|nr:hypothetical protein B0H13DRAFT_1878464 [Mycena leptocephala]